MIIALSESSGIVFLRGCPTQVKYSVISNSLHILGGLPGCNILKDAL